MIRRSCGECTACCVTCAVAELDKPMNGRCVHQSSTGCAIHGRHPVSCNTFSCAWLGGDLPERFRPDKCGIVFWLSDKRAIQASLVQPDIPIDRVRYLVGKIREARPHGPSVTASGGADRSVLLIPPDLRLGADPAAADAIKYVPLGDDLFLASL